ncbi:ankyrin, partial [Ophiobolus disseminans]
VEVLLAAGANVNAINDRGRTALMCVSESRKASSEIIPVLVSNGADVNHVDKSGETALSLIAHFRWIETVDFLLSNGADID